MTTIRMDFFFVVAACMLVLSGGVQAQQRSLSGVGRVGAGVGLGAPAAGAAVGREGASIRIRDFAKPNKVTVARAPEYSANPSTPRKSRSKPREWVLFEVGYETAPEWIDEVEFIYSVMTESKDAEGKKTYSLFQTSVRYTDVIRGEHQSCVALHPNAILRYGLENGPTRGVAAVALEILIDGKPVTSRSEVNMNLPEDWWKNPTVLNNSSLVKRDGYLMDRSKSPFALINSDDYEMVK